MRVPHVCTLIERWWSRYDAIPDRLDAVVVLSGGVMRDGSLPKEGVERIQTGMAMVQQGVAPRLITTRCCLSKYGLFLTSDDAQRALIGGIAWEITPGIAQSSHDEAKAVSAILPAGSHIAVVTSALHSARAARLFERVGFQVVSVVSSDGPRDSVLEWGRSFALATAAFVAAWLMRRL